MLALHFEIYITGVSALGLDSSWLGKRLDERAVKELITLSMKHQFHPSGEGGEYETFVADATFFHKRIQIDEMEKQMRGSSGHLIIKKASLASKNR
jgi:uncharacterized protein (TIGR00290 family)